MENLDALSYFLTQGPFAVLFVWLLFSSHKESRNREQALINESREREGKLHDILDKFSDKYDVIITEIRDMKIRIKE
ncbi:BhlA/UviB family holin-like peptide [Paenibacillus sp. TAB 01]|uniref:BhlA/UviB family holin-like peptide n=1 Tax=Paenibacillus sp. TAB 01 TaxID=3368988 RepID=UPI00375092D8